MDYNPHLNHHGGTEDQKPLFLHDPSLSEPEQHRSQTHHANFPHHRLSHDSSMEVKLVETGGGSSGLSRGSRPHPSYPFQQNQGIEQPFVASSPCEPSPGSSPAPISAAAEYLRHQELNRGQPRKRIYQDWNQVAVFNTPSEAEEGIKNFENCRWKVGNKFTSREGFKVYWSCREGGSCPVQIHLLYHSQLPRVVLFRNQPAHHHAEKVKTRGLLPEVESLIRELFRNGVNKPRRIQFILQKKGMEEVPQTKLSNFLVKLRREASMAGGLGKRGRDSFNQDDYDDDEDEGGPSGSYSNSQDDKSNNPLSPAMFPSVILSTPPDHHQNQSNHYHHPSINQGYGGNSSGQMHNFPGNPRYPSPGYPQHMSGNTGTEPGEIYHHRQSSGYSGRCSGSGGTPGAPTPVKEEEADQSEVVTCSSSRTKSLYCRDETTEDGEHCLPEEEKIKDLVISHIQRSYSNRDMLLIRQELKMLKRENKYTALSRLLAFTAGFLQDTFLEKHLESPGAEGEN